MGGQTSINQPSFAAGEISPALFGRTDLAKYRVGAEMLHNFFVMPYGGAATRPGTAIVGRCKQTVGTKPRNIDFQFNTLQAYILEFGEHYMRVIKNGGYVLEPSLSVTAATAANPAVFTHAAHGYLVGDWLFPQGFTGAWAVLNGTPGYMWIVSAAATNTFSVTDLDGHPVNTTTLGAYPGGATVSQLFTLVTPYAAADLPLLKYTQSADVMTLTHPAYAPMNLTRTAHYIWTLSAITFTALVQPPASSAAAPTGTTGTGSLDYYYIVTASTDAPSEESVQSAVATCTNFSLDQNNGVNNTVTWTAPASGPSPNRYSIYRAQAVATGLPAPTVYGYIGQSLSLSFVDVNFDPDFTQGPPEHSDPFSGGNNPSCSTYYQGRQWFAAPTAFPETIYATQSDNFKNMDTHSPLRADDAITVTLTSRQVNAIKHLVATTALLPLTSGGSWQVSAGGQSDAITPTAILAKPQSFNGCSDVPPLTIAGDILYTQAHGSKVRDLAYNFYTNIFTGTDISILSNHLFYGFELQEWAYCEEPNYQILATRNDGAMLAFTYLKEQDVYAWSRYDTIGDSGADTYQSVAAIPEGAENTAYLIVERTMPSVNGGAPVYYQERQASRNFYVNGVSDVRLAWCVDCGVQYVGDGSDFQTLTGMQHLAGALVSLLVDGSTQTPRRVAADGSIRLDAPLLDGQIATIGLAYQCDLRTLRIDVGEPSIVGKRKKITRLNMTVQDTRGLQISPARTKANGMVVFDQYVEVKERTNQPYASAVALVTGIETLIIKPQWQVDGQVQLRQTYPLPASVLALTPWVSVGDDDG